jgi:pseudouridine synthase
MKKSFPGKMNSEKIQKVLAERGFGSRRKIKEFIREGKIKVDGKPAVIGQRVDPEKEKITFAGKKTNKEQRKVYLALNKPRGVLSTVSDEKGRKTVIGLIEKNPLYKGIRLYPVGRLDKDSCGLMVLTNDGELAYRMTHPSFGLEKKYLVEIRGHPGKKVFKNLINGVQFKEGQARAKSIEIVGKTGRTTVVEIILREGKKREIRRMFELFKFEVISIKRLSIGKLELKETAPGSFRELSRTEIESLREEAFSLDEKEKRGQ